MNIKVTRDKDKGTVTLKTSKGSATIPQKKYEEWLRNPKHAKLPADARYVIEDN